MTWLASRGVVDGTGLVHESGAKGRATSRRCDGAAHAGCQAACYLVWKEAWLEPFRHDEQLALSPVLREATDRTTIPADTKFAMTRIHRFAALPTILVFDRDGKLVLRENGISESIMAEIRKDLGERLPK